VSSHGIVNNTCLNLFLCLFRGDDFRKDYAQLGDLRSILPSHINTIGLTADMPTLTLNA
jgi:superfamily II DNA helicase RecQ